MTDLIHILLLPTYHLVIPIVLIFFKKVSNEWIYRIILLIYFGWAIAIGILLYTNNGKDADSAAGGILMCLLILLCNALQFNLMIRTIELHRCPKCHSLGVKRLSKDVWENIKTTVHTYKYEGKPGIFRKKFQKIMRETYYTLYCEECNHRYEVVITDQDNLKSGEYKVK